MLAIVLLCAAQFMIILDLTVVNVALPSIQMDLGIAGDNLQWIVTAYVLAFGGLLLLGGRAADLFGRRPVFLTGLGVFVAASVVSALADSEAALLVGRALQGVGAAMLSPAALSLVTEVSPEGPSRNRALAAWAAVGAAGGAVGVVLGGLLTEALGWQAIFAINLPIGLAVAIGAIRLLPAGRRAAGTQLDVSGALIATSSLLALIYGLVNAESAGWASAQTLALFGLGAVGFAAFAFVESRASAPLVPLKLLRRRPTVVALVLMLIGMGSVFAGYFFSSQYLQHVLGHSALLAGVEFLPIAVTIVATAHLAGGIVAKVGAKPVLVAGLLIGGLGAFVLSGMSPGGSYVTDVLPGMLLLGGGIGLAASGIFITAMSGATHQDAGALSGLTATSHELGIALVLPVLSTVAAATIGSDALHAGAADPEALTEGFSNALKVAAGIAAGASLLAAVALRRRDAAPDTQPAMAAH